MDGRRLLLVGTYTPDSEPPGEGAGVYRVWFDPVTGEMADGGVAARTPGPSFLAFREDPPTVYAVNERAEGTVTAFRVDGGAELTELGRVPTGGGSPCHVLAMGPKLAVSNYANGVVSVHDLAEDGTIGASTEFAHAGSGPVADRQEGPHAHSCAITSDYSGNQRNRLLAADLGTDEIRVYQLPQTGSTVSAPEHVGSIPLPPGTGPRHMATGYDHLYVAGELDSRVHVVRWDVDTGTGEHAGAVHATGEEAAGSNFPAEIVSHTVGWEDADGPLRLLYVSNRGADSISTFAVREGGARLEHVANTPAGGAWPRNFTVVRGHRAEPDHLVVAAQNGDSLASLLIDPDTGVPTDTGHRLRLPVPVCVLPVPITRIRRAEGATA